MNIDNPTIKVSKAEILQESVFSVVRVKNKLLSFVCKIAGEDELPLCEANVTGKSGIASLAEVLESAPREIDQALSEIEECLVKLDTMLF